jgi:hypothetical protein
MCFWKSFWVYEPVNNFGNIFGCWEIKIGDFGWKRVRTREFCAETDDCSLKRVVSEQPQWVTRTWSLKQTSGRLSEQAQLQHPFDFRSGFSRTNPSFVKHFFQLVKLLFILLNLLEHLIDGIGLDLWSWT